MVRPPTGRGQARPDSGVLSGVLPGPTGLGPGSPPRARSRAASAPSGAAQLERAWEFTRAISPRSHVHRSATLPDGSIDQENKYSATASVAGPCPGVPWVVNLADDTGQYWLLAFDFDAHHLPAADAQRDAYAFVALLERLGDLPYVVCESGPSGGLHVWLATTQGLAAAIVRALATTAARLYPTLDIGPLCNPATGGVRPPGSPHRHGGHSTILYGDTRDLTQPATSPAAIQRLLAELTRLAPEQPAPPQAEGLALVDRQGHLHLPGTRTTLGAAAHAALHSPLSPDADASAVLFSALLGAARARWRFDDVHALLDTAPGLEHARTTRITGTGRHRIPRTPRDQRRILTVQWDRAVRHVAATKLTKATTDSTELTEKAARVTRTVEAALARMKASPGRWTDPTATDTARGAYGQQRAMDRLVLLELYQRALDGLTTEVRASVRTLAMSLPFNRESVRTSLKRLVDDGWIAPATPPEGPTAAAWFIEPHHVFHKEALSTRSAGGPTPLSSPAPEIWARRAKLQAHLHALTDPCEHDVFQPKCLGPQSAFVYAAALASPGATLDELSRTAAVPRDVLDQELRRLDLHGLIRLTGDTWHAYERERLDAIARLHGVLGDRADTARRYRIEQATYSYWLAEVGSTTRSAALTRGHLRTVTLPNGATVALGAYPRSHDRTPNWREARDRIEDAMAA